MTDFNFVKTKNFRECENYEYGNQNNSNSYKAIDQQTILGISFVMMVCQNF
jgi:hypothetical protein